MRESRGSFFILDWQRDPQLQAMQRLAAIPVVGRRALGMNDAAAGGHPIDGAGSDRHGAAEAVAMHDLAIEQICHRRQADMRMRPHVDAVANAKDRRAEMIEENERPDHARARRWQSAPDLQAAEIDRTRHDDLRNRIARSGVAEDRVLGRKETHIFDFSTLQIRR